MQTNLSSSPSSPFQQTGHLDNPATAATEGARGSTEEPVSSPVFSVLDHGAKGDGSTLNTVSIQQTIDHCAAQGGGAVVLPGGIYLSGELFLRSNVHLYLEKGAILRGSPAMEHYIPEPDGVPGGFLFAKNVSNIGIRGPGTIDGNGHRFWDKMEQPYDWAEAKKPLGTWAPHFDYMPRKRPRALILFAGCNGILIENISVIDSCHWTLLLLRCSHAAIRGILIDNPVHGPNTDGIDLDACQDVVVENCVIDTGDDAIALKNKNTWGLKRASRRITVRGCTLRSPTHGFTIGTETQDDFEDITFCDSTIGPAQGHATMTGIGLSILDGAAIRNVKVSNIRIEGAVAPIQIRLGNEGRGQAVRQPGRIENLRLDNITAEGAKGVSLLTGLPDHPLHNIHFTNYVAQHEGGLPEGAALTTVPELESEYPVNTVWRFLPCHALYARHVRDLALEGVSFTVKNADARPAAVFDDVTFAAPVAPVTA